MREGGVEENEVELRARDQLFQQAFNGATGNGNVLPRQGQRCFRADRQAPGATFPRT